MNTRLPPEQHDAHAQLEVARNMVRHGGESLRRSLMNLRAQELERGDLTQALPELARQITVGTGIDLRCEIERPPRSLPEVVEANLLRIGQECLANAVQHARPRRIDLSVSQTPGGVRLRIADDGAGFDPGQLKSDGNGHFGWRGIHERAAQIGAEVQLDTQPGRGTTVTVTVLVSTTTKTSAARWRLAPRATCSRTPTAARCWKPSAPSMQAPTGCRRRSLRGWPSAAPRPGFRRASWTCCN